MSGTESRMMLNEVVGQFITQVRDRSAELGQLSDREAAEEVMRWPVAQQVNDAALIAARQADYIYRSGEPFGPDRWGRVLSSGVLQGTGIIGLLRSTSAFPADQLAAEVTAFLSGPSIPIQHHVVLDADLYLDGSMEVAGWRLWLPTPGDLDKMRPIPTGARHTAIRGWDPLLYRQESWLLSRENTDAGPRQGSFLPGRISLELFEASPDISAWQPLLLLNLYSLNPVNAVSEYEVEPGRFLERVRGDRLVSESVGVEGEYEVVSHGPLSTAEREIPGFRQFLTVMSAYLAAWEPERSCGQVPKKDPVHSLRRSAERYMSVNPWLGYEGDVTFAGRRAEVIFWYITALEHLVTVGDQDHTELTRRVTQRVAVLVGQDDDNRLHVEQLVRKGYRKRSELAHGSTPDQADLSELAKGLRSVLRKALIRRIILGPAFQPALACDQALLSTKIRQASIESPIAEAAAKLRAAGPPSTPHEPDGPGVPD